MASENEIDITGNEASQNLYADSDLAPISSLFGEMGSDRSFLSKAANFFDFIGDSTKVAISPLFLIPEAGRDFGLDGSSDEVNKNLRGWGTSRDALNDGFTKYLTSFRKSERSFLEDEKNRNLIFEKIYQSGLLSLAEMAGGIREFARLRFQEADTLRKSATEYADPVRDTMWMQKLNQAKDYFFADPVALATVYKFFPNLYRLYITALAATAGYSGTEDPLNDSSQMLESLFKAFGTDQNGKATFKAIWAKENLSTAQRILEADAKIRNVNSAPPVNPDIFHLRLGAANFYVPPISISVNTGFKTGSLTGGAIRQKASPKFNSGYRDTTINLKLFFPNYEEIWGITVDDATKISLQSNFYIDFKDPEHEKKIDKFISSLRGLVAAFKYSPILPIKNHYLNSVFNITGVALSSMTISTVPNYPFTLEVDLELFQFNHKPFLPMINDFNQAVNWGKYRQYMGKAAGSLANSVNSEFLMNTVEGKTAVTTGVTTDPSLENGYDTIVNSPYGSSYEDKIPYNNGVLTTNVMNDWVNGNGITLYIPESVQSKIYSPDVSMFRSEEEAAITQSSRSLWDNLMGQFGITLLDFGKYRSLDTVIINSLNQEITLKTRDQVARVVEVALAGANSKTTYEQVYDAAVISYINYCSEVLHAPLNTQSIDYLKNRKSPNDVQAPVLTTPEATNALIAKKWELYLSSQSVDGLLSQSITNNVEAILRKRKVDIIDKTSKEWISLHAVEEKKFMDAFTILLYERTFKDEGIKSLLGQAAIKQSNQLGLPAFTIKEWEVPMMKVDLDPNSVIVNSVSLSMGNNLAKMQLQMQEEPTFQHIGSKDTMISISLTVFGEKELTKIKKMFDFLSGLARLEHAAGVIGFMGIKNIITALSGVKYVLPISFTVDTVPGYPHVYNVNLMLADFDIFQQKRENISSEQQIDFIKTFGTKRNPFLRLKQRWDMINAYPDMPLSVVDPDTKLVVGSMDPDYYFRSFEMFDNDVVNSIVEPHQYTIPTGEWQDEKTHLNDRGKSYVYFVKKMLIESSGDYNAVKKYLIDDEKLPAAEAMKIFRIAIFDQQSEPEFQTDLQSSRFIANKYPTLWKDMIDSFQSDEDIDYKFEDIKFNTRYGDFKIGDLVSGSKEEMDKFNKLITLDTEKDKNELPSFDPDDVDHFGVMHLIPAADSGTTDKIPAIYQTPDGGYVMGYSNKKDGRFYIAQDFLRLSSDGKLTPTSQVTKISDTQAPERDSQVSHTGVVGAASLSQTTHAYGSDQTDKMQSVQSAGTHKGVAKHWQKMMLDTQYRDTTGRMLRAFPTYMLWLIDDSNYFAGVKLFDNFYGLQSIIDFSIVQSEDILGDTLVLRLSNTYSKLSRPEATISSIVDLNGELTQNIGTGSLNTVNLSSGTAQIIDTLITRSMNIKSHMSSKYVTEIDHIRLKPGVRVHLRAGYGSNPNSLQTVFNGVIAEVEHGEIMTITAQSDAVELSPIINSTKKKGDSGKIDGGINTGLWMSEPRDLMVRLLSMGASRMREAFSHATRGAVFSENKFGIRHFGSILYAPLTPEEQAKHDQYRQSVINAFNAIGNNPISGSVGLAWNSAANLITGGALIAGSSSLAMTTAGLSPGIGGNVGMESAGGSVRTPVVGAMQSLWGNFSTQRDLEIFKRNIYPGNGVGVAQFLGGDLDDGWATMASIDISSVDQEKFGYLNRLSNDTWSNLIDQSSKPGGLDASVVLDQATSQNKLVNSSHSIGLSKVISGGISGAVGSYNPLAGMFLGVGLLKSLNGRGASNIMKTLGLMSDSDDDIYDEVSFRAQTYMRSVWDMFQMCAKLLPNYIVAVRPFEDRSTIFYGKPHWLYTSGVFPVSTGFPNEEQAKKEGSTIPGYIEPDDSLQKILLSVNKEMTPNADALASLQNKESSISEDIANISKDMINMSGVFKAGRKLKGRIINFSDKGRNAYYEYGKVKSRLPVNKGKVQVGFHLPFNKAGTGIDMSIQQDHQQIPMLPIRFSYPFFTNRVSGTLPSLDFDKIVHGAKQENLIQSVASLVKVSLIDKNLVIKDKDTEKTALVSQKPGDDEPTLDFNFNFAAKLPLMGIQDILINQAAFDPSGIYDPKAGLGQINASQTVRMPVPFADFANAGDIDGAIGESVYLNEKFTKYFDDLDPAYQLSNSRFPSLSINFTEWGMPKNADDEQFYIAMRWPYDPTSESSIKAREALSPTWPGAKSKAVDLPVGPDARRDTLKKFLNMYNIREEDLAGSPEDYKKRKVLVYNPEKKTAVVCTPAYFLWGKTEADGSGSNKIDAIISPDAAYFLGLLINDKGQILSPLENIGVVSSAAGKEMGGPEVSNSTNDQWAQLGMAEKNLTECMFTFVDDSTPVGVVTSQFNPSNRFSYDKNISEDTMLIGFGAFKAAEDNTTLSDIAYNQWGGLTGTVLPAKMASATAGVDTRMGGKENLQSGVIIKNEFTYDDVLAIKTDIDWAKEWELGGNYLQYYSTVMDGDLNDLAQDKLLDKVKDDRKNKKFDNFASVYDVTDNISVIARGYYDENFDSKTKTIAGNGRTVKEAEEIWDQFRYGYHNYDSVKNIFQTIFQLDPDDNEPSNDALFQLLSKGKTDVLEEFGADPRSNEFSTLLGADWTSTLNAQTAAKQSAVNIAVTEYVDAGYVIDENTGQRVLNQDAGLVDLYNELIVRKVKAISNLVENSLKSYEYSTYNEPGASANKHNEDAQKMLAKIDTPKKLYLMMVGLFRQKLWKDPYSRAWLVLRPDKKRFNPSGTTQFVMGTMPVLAPVVAGFNIGNDENDQWSFRPVDKIWAAFIDYKAEYSTSDSKLKSLLQKNAHEGNGSSNWIQGVAEDANNFWNRNIGPIYHAFTASLGNLLNMFRMSMAQMGYGLNELENFTKQANILNKAYNDSIYYSLGRPGTLLRAVDNPFTREYGEPVVEVREPFQRLHYISSFTHILSNNIKENTGGIATQITAVSDGKYPVTVSLDKSAPPEKQVEKTVETGLYFDNVKGEGVWGILHPIFHPLQTARGIAKAASGDPDELSARRVALAHLKESLKDIYDGEIIVIGNTDIRPHDLVYLADVYERMYGIFEVEQVVHHFTPETGFITSIKPNAFVTVNDPARWFMSSWIASRFSMQNLRNDTRMLLSSKSNNPLTTMTGEVSVDHLSDLLKDQMMGGIQYTHGHSALLKDIQANQVADTMPEGSAKIKEMIKASTGNQGNQAGAAIVAGIVMPVVTAAATIATMPAGPIVSGMVAGAGALLTDAAWGAWKWVRDNVLDQHGCYIQYLSKNGQAMDAGLSNFQGMVVGRASTKRLLPKALGIKTNVKSESGYAWIRSDDLLKSLGWKEKQISNLVRYTSLENAIVHAELLKYSGLGPEKTGLNQYFKTIVRVTHVRDGDTFEVVDVLGNIKEPYAIRFDGINTAELDKITVSQDIAVVDPQSSASKALVFTNERVYNKLIALRINPNRPDMILTADDLEAGATKNNIANYSIAREPNASNYSEHRYMGTVFYKTDPNSKQNIINKLKSIFLAIPEGTSDSILYVKDKAKELINPASVISTRFDTLYLEYDNLLKTTSVNYQNGKYSEYLEIDPEHLPETGDPLGKLTQLELRSFDVLVNLLILEKVYDKASEWPVVSWDEYYDDGSPITLNWELVVNNLARVYTETLNYISGPALNSSLNPELVKVNPT
jgi:hypothetical protein